MVESSLGPTTERMIALSQSVNPEPPARELDMLVANGETITAPLVAMCLEGMGVPAISLSGLQAGVRTSAQHSRARIQDINPGRILEALRVGKVPVVAGFQGATESLEITTLGRGGSDTTAVALAAAFPALMCACCPAGAAILTDAPRVVGDARRLPCRSSARSPSGAPGVPTVCSVTRHPATVPPACASLPSGNCTGSAASRPRSSSPR